MIRKLIEGVFKGYKYYTSPIVILRYPQKIEVKLNIFKFKSKKRARRIRRYKVNVSQKFKKLHLSKLDLSNSGVASKLVAAHPQP